MVTSEEIEEMIVKLHNDGKNMREISKHEGVRKNFTFIGAVLKKYFPEEYSDTASGKLTKETQALKLFSVRKSPTQAAIELNETPDSIEKYFMDYWRLQRMQSLYNIYRENKKAVPNLLRLYDLFQKKRIYPKMYDEVADLIENQMFRADDPALKSMDIKHMSEEQALKSDRYLEWLESGFP